MMPTPVIAIFDVGKTNKKLVLFDQDYKIVYEKSARFTEIADDDGFPCENLESLKSSVLNSLNEVFRLKEFDVKAVNFSTYGASLVFVDEKGDPLTPLYNYLKPYPEELSAGLYERYGGQDQFASETASPALGSLNSGLVLYRLKKHRPEIFSKMKCALHLPQYLSFLLSGRFYSDITSIGCHTAMWDFNNGDYHQWMKKERLLPKLAPTRPADTILEAEFKGRSLKTGTGLHDSSAALIPYQLSFSEPFVLISTGTWCISMNPFNNLPLTKQELDSDCLCYLEYRGKPVKASRLFAGHQHELEVKRIAAHFNQDTLKFRAVPFQPALIFKLQQSILQNIPFGQRDLALFEDDMEAYHQLMADIAGQQKASAALALQDSPVKRIFVDGGFSKNTVYMNLLACAFPELEVYAASMAQATAMGSAMAIHGDWNSQPLPGDKIELKYYSPNRAIRVSQN